MILRSLRLLQDSTCASVRIISPPDLLLSKPNTMPLLPPALPLHVIIEACPTNPAKGFCCCLAFRYADLTNTAHFFASRENPS